MPPIYTICKCVIFTSKHQTPTLPKSSRYVKELLRIFNRKIRLQGVWKLISSISLERASLKGLPLLRKRDQGGSLHSTLSFWDTSKRKGIKESWAIFVSSPCQLPPHFKHDLCVTFWVCVLLNYYVSYYFYHSFSCWN